MKIKEILKLLLVFFMFFPIPAGAKSSVVSDAVIINWAGTAAQNIMNFDFSTFDNKKAENKTFFTKSGYESFYKAMDAAQISEHVKSNKLLVQSDVKCTPEIKSKTEENGKKVWEVEFSIGLDYISGHDIRKDNQKVIMILKQDSSVQNDLGIGIEQWIAKPIANEDASVCGSKEQTKARIGELRREIAQREAEIKALEAQLP